MIDLISGTNMSSIPAGKVGIGISSPTVAKLHVISDSETGGKSIVGEYSETGPEGWLGTQIYGVYGNFFYSLKDIFNMSYVAIR